MVLGDRSSAPNNQSFAVEAKRIVRRFGDVFALADVSLSVKEGEFFSLLGPSGCGKTTLLRIIAGLDLPNEGTLTIGGRDALDVPAHLRPVNTVFQSYALFPHLSVRDNVAFGLKMKGVKPAEITRRVKQVTEMVRVDDLLARFPAQLSGGQQQRVALARAVINEPQVLLLDEPLGALDLKLRKELQIELLSLQRRLGITFLFVTHDQEEALALSDRIAVFNQGKIEQVGDVESLYEFPETKFVSGFLGSSNILKARVVSEDGTSMRVETDIGALRVDLSAQKGRLQGRRVLNLAIRPEKVCIQAAAESNTENVVRASVEEVLYIGSESHYIFRLGERRISGEMMNTRVGSQGFEVGQETSLLFPPSALIVLND